MTFESVAYSGGSDEHDTPIEFFAPLADAVNGFDLDPCASQTSDLAETNLTKEDGGLREWWGKVFCNPPYSDVSRWMEHCKKQHQFGNTELIVGLVYARTGTQWFHNHVVTADYLCFVEGRLTFGSGDYSAPAPSLVPVWGEASFKLLEALKDTGILIASQSVVNSPTGQAQPVDCW